MRRDVLLKIELGCIVVILIIIALFGKEIMAAISDAINAAIMEQTESLFDQLLR